MAQPKQLNINKENELVQIIINDLFSNRWDECENILQKYKLSSPNLCFANVIFSMMKAALLLDDVQLNKASEEIEICQKICKDDTGLIMSTVKSFISLVYTPTHDSNVLYDRLLKDIITADCKFYNAALVILKKERTTSLFHGMLEIRRAWKLYSTLQKKLFNSYKALEPRAEQIYGSDPNKLPIIEDNYNDEEDGDGEDNFSDANESFTEEKYEKNSDQLSLDDVKELLAAVSFGYGVMQLCISFLPNRLLKLVSLFGFQGDRGAALKSIYFTSHSNNIRSPLADIVLLAYSIVGPQIFGKSEIEMYLDKKEINQILEKNLKKNPTSSLFLYFKTKFYELNLKDINEAMKYAQLAHNYSKKIPEFQTLTWFEMGFLNLLNLNIEKSLACFEEFTKDSKWSLSFNVYIKILLKGCLEIDNNNHLKKEIDNALKISCRRNFIEKFSKNRINYLSQFDRITKYMCELLLVEMLYFWMFIPYCCENSLRYFLEILNNKNETQYRSVRYLLEGSIYFALKEDTLAVKLLKSSIDAHKDDIQAPISRYTLPYAHCQLCCHYIDINNLDLASNHLNMAKSFTEFEFRSRLQAQLRSIERRLNYKMTLGVEETYL